MTRLHLDWGSTNLRVYRIENGRVVETRASGDGAAACRSAADFLAVFDRATEGWLDRAEKVLLSGMVTRKGGWIETPYLPVPTDLSRLAEHAVAREVSGRRLDFLPGLSQADPPDVIRGEETALLGMAEPGEVRLIVLPGTHSKWVVMNGTTVQSFRTFMTGEMFGLALRNSLAGQLAEGEGEDKGAFADGVAEASKRTPLASIFQTRSRVLVGGADARGTSSFLSGLFVASEILEAMRLHPDIGSTPALVGAGHLVATYAEAFRLLGLDATPCGDEAALRGIEKLAASA